MWNARHTQKKKIQKLNQLLIFTKFKNKESVLLNFQFENYKNSSEATENERSKIDILTMISMKL